MSIQPYEDIPCELIDLRTGNPCQVGERIEELVRNGWACYDLAKTFQRNQQEIEAELVKILGMNVMARIRGLCQVKARKHTEVVINNEARLFAVLRERFGADAPQLTDRYITTENLVQLACDGDDPIAPRVRECLTITKKYSLEWEDE